ncbi:ethanolamine ammonia-lyase subunit EutC [Camelimonas abortus]|uniref:Ethanolamine ammonia-lyase small subunit n=1 Tax=Camelimonas abortus TaxID=1017184 RepID=A0ABV7LBR4_9HYPH
MTAPDLFDLLRRRTHARVALGRAGDGLPTAPLLAFQMAHARARDAVHGALDVERLARDLAPLPAIHVRSAAGSRAVYLRRPDLGRRLAEGEAARLPQGPFDVALVIADGLSAVAAARHGPAVAHALARLLPELAFAPVVIASQGRVAIGDDIAAAMNAELAVTLIGERPGLSTADSLGAYLTFRARPGMRDSERNCVSNIHDQGLAPAVAAEKIAWLAREALRLRLTGVALKENAPVSAVAGPASGPLLEGAAAPGTAAP